MWFEVKQIHKQNKLKNHDLHFSGHIFWRKNNPKSNFKFFIKNHNKLAKLQSYYIFRSFYLFVVIL
jgi:hypothetical protein